MMLYAVRRNSDPPLLQAQKVRDNFSVQKWVSRERLLLAACVGLSFPDIAAKEQ